MTAPDSTTILPAPPSPPPYCDRSSRGCIPPPTTARTSTARKSNARHCTLDEGGLGIKSNNQQLWGRSRRRDPRGGAGGREGGFPEEGGGGDGSERARAELKRDRSFGGGPRAALRAGRRLAGAGADPSGT